MFFSLFAWVFRVFTVTLHRFSDYIIKFKINKMINSQEIKIGTCIRMDGKVWV